MDSERCTYSPEQAAACSQTASSATTPSALSSSTPTVAPCSENEPQRDGFPSCECMSKTSDCSIHPSTPDAWIASQAAFLASRLAQLERDGALKTSGSSSERCFAVYEPFDPNTSFSKMSQDCSQAKPENAYAAGLIDGEGCIRIQKQSNKRTYIVVVQVAMTDKARPIASALLETFGGRLYEQQFSKKEWADQWMWRINGGEALVFLNKIYPFLMLKKAQAETAMELEKLRESLPKHPNGTSNWTEAARKAAEALKQRMHSLNKKGPDARSAGAGFYSETADLFGTRAPFLDRLPRWGSMRNGRLYQQPIPALRIGVNGSGYWPTPTARDWKSGKASEATMQKNSRPLSEQIGGSLNPPFVEWLMGWPLGYTVSKHWATAKSRSKPRSRGES